MSLNLAKDATLKPTMLNLVKSIDPLLQTHGLTGHRAKVALILDWSGSMHHLYVSGQIQTLVNRFVALGHRFDDDGAIDLFAYHGSAKYIGELTAHDCDDVQNRIQKVMGSMGGTDYAAGFKAFRQYAFGSSSTRDKPLKQDLPWYVGFITDGSNGGSARDCIDQVRSASYEPAFFQCIALGADYDPNGPKKTGFFSRLTGTTGECPSEFAFLDKLDTNVSGRYVDNANFFATSKPDALNDIAFFNRMMGEYPQWLGEAQTKGLI